MPLRETEIASMRNALRKLRFYFLGSPLYDAYTRNLRTTHYGLGREKRFAVEWNRSAANRPVRCRSLNPIHNTSFTCLLNNRDRTMYTRVSFVIYQFYTRHQRAESIKYRAVTTRICCSETYLTVNSRINVTPKIRSYKTQLLKLMSMLRFNSYNPRRESGTKFYI